MIETIVRGLERVGMARDLHDTLAKKAGEQRVLIEGFYVGDWLESHVEGWYLHVPEDAVRLGHRIITAKGTSVPSDRSQLHLVERRGEENRISDRSLRLQGSVSAYGAFCDVRTLLTEDGRVYHRPELLASTNGNERILPNFLNFVKEKGFDEVFKNIGQILGILCFFNFS